MDARVPATPAERWKWLRVHGCQFGPWLPDQVPD